MLYLFNDSADPKVTPKDIWLTQKGEPVFVTQTSDKLNSPQGSKTVGKIDSAQPEAHQLSKDGQLTTTGEKYCEAMGVGASHASLTKFVEHAKHKAVKLDAVIPSLEIA